MFNQRSHWMSEDKLCAISVPFAKFEGTDLNPEVYARTLIDCLNLYVPHLAAVSQRLADSTGVLPSKPAPMFSQIAEIAAYRDQALREVFQSVAADYVGEHTQEFSDMLVDHVVWAAREKATEIEANMRIVQALAELAIHWAPSVVDAFKVKVEEVSSSALASMLANLRQIMSTHIKYGEYGPERPSEHMRDIFGPEMFERIMQQYGSNPFGSPLHDNVDPFSRRPRSQRKRRPSDENDNNA